MWDGGRGRGVLGENGLRGRGRDDERDRGRAGERFKRKVFEELICCWFDVEMGGVVVWVSQRRKGECARCGVHGLVVDHFDVFFFFVQKAHSSILTHPRPYPPTLPFHHPPLNPFLLFLFLSSLSCPTSHLIIPP